MTRPEGTQPALFDDTELRPADDPNAITVHVLGLPKPQGSTKSFLHPRTKAIVTTHAGGDSLWNWRASVAQAMVDVIDGRQPYYDAGVAVEVRLGFDLPRPQGHFGTGGNAGTVRASAPIWPAITPDLDKLVRAILDSGTDAGLWKDDKQVCVIHAAKRYGSPSGVLIQVRRA